jgi:hypothetical protein
MSYLPEPNDNGDFQLPPAGTHLGVCYQVILLGHQPSTYNGVTKHKPKIWLAWELPDELMEDGQPFTVRQTYTWSMSQKAKLREDLKGWRGKDFEEKDFGNKPGAFNIKNVLGKCCLLNIVHNVNGEKTYANVQSISRVMKGQPLTQKTANPLIYFWLNKELFDSGVYSGLSDYLKKKIASSPEYDEIVHGVIPDETGMPDRTRQTRRPGDLDDTVPF